MSSALLFLGLCAIELQGQDAGASAFERFPTSAAELRFEHAARRALDDGLAYLARRATETVDGSLPVDDAHNPREQSPIGVSALGALAFMAAGHSPGRGPHAETVERVLDYLLEHADLAPESSTHGYVSSRGDRFSRMHGHGYATLALAQAYGMAPRRSDRIHHALVAAVQRIESTQGNEGGWYYEPQLHAQHEGSVTICLVQALRAAQNVGIQVDSKVIERAESYVIRLQKPDGTFRYGLDVEDSTVALTAAGVATLNMAGRYDDAIIQNAIDAIWSGLALQEDGGRAEFPFYQRFYLAQAFWQLSDTSHFERWFEPEKARLLRTQDADGSWTDRRFGSCYATASNCLVLAMPEGVLPIFQR